MTDFIDIPGKGKRPLVACGILAASLTAAQAQMAVSFDWGPTKKCYDPNSPPMRLYGVPEGTKELSIVMTDRNSTYNHASQRLLAQDQRPSRGLFGFLKKAG